MQQCFFYSNQAEIVFVILNMLPEGGTVGLYNYVITCGYR